MMGIVVFLMLVCGARGILWMNVSGNASAGCYLTRENGKHVYAGCTTRWIYFTVVVPYSYAYTITLCVEPNTVGFTNISTDQEMLYMPLYLQTGSQNVTLTTYKRPWELRLEVEQVGAAVCLPSVVPQYWWNGQSPDTLYIYASNVPGIVIGVLATVVFVCFLVVIECRPLAGDRKGLPTV